MTITLDKSSQKNISKIKSDLGNSTDLIIRFLNVNEKISIGLVYFNGLADKEMIEHSIIEALLKLESHDNTNFHLEFLKEKILANPEVSNVNDFQTLYPPLLSGDTAIFIDGQEEAFLASTRKSEERGVAEPTTQVVIRGPKDSFVENINVNIALIRRRIKDQNLWLETREIGHVTKTSVSLVFLHGTVDEQILNEVRKRLDQIDTNGILESGYIEEFIQDSTFSPFPTVYNTERPDVIAAGILEGRIAI
nr:spore germination protein [Anaerobacillus sp. CMMVII]